MTSPLVDEEDFDAIVAAQEQLASLEPELERAMNAGLNVAEHQKRLGDMKQRLSAIRNAFFPGR